MSKTVWTLLVALMLVSLPCCTASTLLDSKSMPVIPDNEAGEPNEGAWVLKYFFRGELEISNVFAIADGAASQQGFTKIKAKVKNISTYDGFPEKAGEGTLWAIARYRVQEGYAPLTAEYATGRF